MNYARIYDELIKDRRARPVPDGYTEKHHIVPKSLGGSNDADNLIRLSMMANRTAAILIAHYIHSCRIRRK